MAPITFTCSDVLALPPEAIAERILELANWTEFKGYGILPGIRSAQFAGRTPEVVGTRIRVVSTDGSSHIEEIAEWEPSRHLRIVMHEFTWPLSRLATHFEESWRLERAGGETNVVRAFSLHPRSRLSRFCLRLIAIFLRRAIVRHLRQMRAQAHQAAQRSGSSHQHRAAP